MKNRNFIEHRLTKLESELKGLRGSFDHFLNNDFYDVKKNTNRLMWLFITNFLSLIVGIILILLKGK